MQYIATYKLPEKLIYITGSIFILLCAATSIMEHYWFLLVPFCLLLAVVLFLRFDIIFFFVAFCTPFSIEMEHFFEGASLSIPTEPILAALMMIILINLFAKNNIDRKIIFHPITIAITLNLLWIGLTTITSQMPLVSIKFFISRLWFVVCFYFAGLYIFNNIQNIKKFIWFFIFPLMCVIVYTIIIHSQQNFTYLAATWAMNPFFRDHGVYAAVISLFIPLLIVFNLKSKEFRFNLLVKILFFFITLLFITAIILSYTRASWLGLTAALFAYILFVLKIRFRTLCISGAVLTMIVILFYSDIEMVINKNRQDSSTKFSEHLESMYNVSSNASNLERVNRWKSAISMFIEHPVMGFGPGTYMFSYAPFQFSKEMTIISTNAGTLGNAHSEYIGPLAESGILGSLTIIIIVLLVIYYGMKIFYTAQNKQIKYLSLGILLGMITYFIHGLLNNYLDQDKAAIPFWAFAACITALSQQLPVKTELYQ